MPMMSIVAPTLKDDDKPKIFQLAVAAMEELVRMAEIGEPLWTRNYLNGTTVLNENEYIQTLPRWIRIKPVGFQREASRETVVVLMNRVNIIEILMDVNQWSAVFSSIVSQAMTLELLSSSKGEAGTYNGVLQVMTAEFQVPSPIVSTRQSHYLRYCKQLVEDTWAVVDVSLDNILQTNRAVRCRRRPSGCLIQEMPKGYSKVTWVENVEVDYRGVHDLYMQLVSSGYAFGAKRWVVTLDRHCLRLAIASNITTNSHTGDVRDHEERKRMLRMADRMMISFLAGVSANPDHTWKTVLSGTGGDDVRLMTRDSIYDPTRPPGLVLCATTSFRLPVSPIRVFDFLRDDTTRNQWDVLSNEGVVLETAHIANGWNTSNCVSLLRVLDNTENSSQGKMLLVQESRSDPTASFVIYAPVDTVAMDEILNGGEYPDYLTLLPSGFAILPDGTAVHRGSIDAAASGGSLLTVSFQIFVDLVPNARVSLEIIATIINLVACTVEKIKASLSCEDA